MGFLGLENGHLFATPSWVDSKKPGTTSLTKIYGRIDWWQEILTLKSFFLSPNLLWFLIAVFVYVVFPYDFESGKNWSLSYFMSRFYVNFLVFFSYTSFWYITLYILGWANRKFDASYRPSGTRLFHNVFYSFLGVVQWTAWEVVFVYIYANHKMAFISDDEAFTSFPNIVRMVFWSLAVPVWRDFHFYFAHRFIHIRVLYKYVHSLHHRNLDPEPFSGLSMHPIEHLYYYSCIAPSLFFLMSPFHFLWNGIHLLISPAASHSGWEDHFQSDLMHYLHHTKFECNYGTGGIPFDKWFGTFRDKIGESKTYRGNADDVKEEPITSNGNGKKVQSGFLGGVELSDVVPTGESLVYNLVNYVMAGLVFAGLVGGENGIGKVIPSWVFGAMLGIGPVVSGVIIRSFGVDKLSLRWPFHKDAVLGSFGLHIVVGFCVTVVPIYYTITTAMS